MTAGLKTQFLAELLELLGELLGPVEHQRLTRRLSSRHQQWLGPKTQLRPELTSLEDIEEILLAVEDSATTQRGCYETAVAELVARRFGRRSWLLSELPLRTVLERLLPFVEELWPLLAPSFTIDDTGAGLRITTKIPGYSRCTRLLAYQLLGTVNAAYHAAASNELGEVTTTVDLFGDRARIDVLVTRLDPPPVDVEDAPPPRRPSVRPRLRPSLAAEVESILGHRTASQPPPPSSLRSPSSPNLALPTGGAFPSTRKLTPAPALSDTPNHRRLTPSPQSDPKPPSIPPGSRRPG